MLLHPEDPGLPPVKYSLRVPKAATYADLRQLLGAEAGVPPECIVLADVYVSRFYSFFNDSARIWQVLLIRPTLHLLILRGLRPNPTVKHLAGLTAPPAVAVVQVLLRRARLRDPRPASHPLPAAQPRQRGP